MHDNRELVCILLSIYYGDNIEYVKESIDSLLRQTYSNIKIFIGIDGPLSQELIATLSTFDNCPKIKIFYFEKNRGLACVLNDLIQECFKIECNFIARMDADDISVENRIEVQMDFLLSHSDVDVVGCAICEIDKNSIMTNKTVKYPLTHDACKKFFRYRDPLAHPAVLFRSTFFQNVSGYRNEYRKNQDTMLWFDGFFNNCRFANLEETLLYFRVTKDFYKNRRNGYKRAIKMLKDRWIINKSLHYDLSAYLFSFLMFFITLMPVFIKKRLYKVR